jgi:hypothetical protein
VEEVSRWQLGWFGRIGRATNRPQPSLSGCQVGLDDSYARLVAILSWLLALVGPLIHVRLNNAF